MKKFIYVALAAIFAAVPAFAQIMPAQIRNFSARGKVEAGQHRELILGFNVAAALGVSPELTKRFVVRAVGPKLASLSVPDAISDPAITIYDSAGKEVKRNDNWDNDAALNVLFSQVGAFALDPNGRDAALWVELKPGSYTAVATIASGGAGTALLEVYDAQRDTGLLRLSNVSVRGFGDDVTVGWVADGVGQKRFLVRGIGPGLATFGVNGFMQDPTLTAYNNGGTVLASNSDWSGSEVSDAAVTVGAFTLQAGSKDAAFIITRSVSGPVSTTARVTGTAGIAVVEVYDL